MLLICYPCIVPQQKHVPFLSQSEFTMRLPEILRYSPIITQKRLIFITEIIIFTSSLKSINRYLCSYTNRSVNRIAVSVFAESLFESDAKHEDFDVSGSFVQEFSILNGKERKVKLTGAAVPVQLVLWPAPELRPKGRCVYACGITLTQTQDRVSSDV